MLPLSVLFFLIIEQSVSMFLVFYEECMLEKVTMQRTPQFADFFVIERPQINAAHA